MKTEKPGVTTPTYPVFHVCDGIFIKQNSSRVKYLYADILYVEASRSYSDIHFKGGSKITIALPLLVVEQKFPHEPVHESTSALYLEPELYLCFLW